MSLRNTAETVGESDVERTTEGPSRTVDWAVSLLLVLSGSLFAAGGFLLYTTANLTQVTRWVAEGRITSATMTNAELIDVIYGMWWGGGIGVAVLGALLVLTAAVFYGLRTRSRRRFEATGVLAPSATGNAIIGGIVTIGASVIPLSPVLGGGVAAYLQGEASGIRTGALAGLFAAVPIVVLYAVIVGSLLVGAPALTGVVVSVLLISLLVAVVYLVALSAAGGYIGARFADRDDADATA